MEKQDVKRRNNEETDLLPEAKKQKIDTEKAEGDLD